MRSKNGFTLMEILVVISILAILTAVGFVTYTGLKHQAYDAKVDVTLDQVENALRIYTRSLNKKIPMKYYSGYDKFYAKPDEGQIDTQTGLRIYHGGGYGTELAKHKLIGYDLLKALEGGPNRERREHGPDIRVITCGKDKIFIYAESYSGISQAELGNMMSGGGGCAWKTELDWRKEHGLPSPWAWGSGSGTNNPMPYFKYREINL